MKIRKVLYELYLGSYSEEAFEIANSEIVLSETEPRNRKDVAFSYLILSQLSLVEKQHDEARVYLSSAKEIYDEIGFEKESQFLFNISSGHILFIEKEYQKALEYYDSSIKYYKNIYHYNKKNTDALLSLYDDKIYMLYELAQFKDVVNVYADWLKVFRELYAEDHKNYNLINERKLRLEAAIREKEKGFPNAIFEVTNHVDTKSFMDTLVAEHLVSSLPNPSQDSLNELLKRVNRVKIFKLFEGTGQSDFVNTLYKDIHGICHFFKIRRFKKSLKINTLKKIGFQEFVYPRFVFFLYRHNKKLAELHYLGRNTIRISDLWKTDAILEHNHFVRFLAKLGIEEPETYYMTDKDRPHSHKYHEEKSLSSR